MADGFRRIEREHRKILNRWIESCTRGGKVSRSTVAIGLVVLDHLRKEHHTSRVNVVSPGGEIRGARSGLATILESYSVPRSFLKEVTTRQAHQDGQRLLEALDWGQGLGGLPDKERDSVLLGLTSVLTGRATEWLKRQNLKMQLDRGQAPARWVQIIVENARDRSSGGVVEQHLVGAKLERRFKSAQIPNHPAHAGDRQTVREGDFTVSNLVYHVTSAPSRDVILKCAQNLSAGRHPILLVPADQELKAKVLAQEDEIDGRLTIMSIEGFVALNVIEIATDEQKDFFTVLSEIVRIYTKRLAEVETDLSLMIEVR